MSAINKPYIFITPKIPKPGLELLQKHFIVKVYEGKGTAPRNIFLSELAGGKESHLPDAVLCHVTDIVDAQAFETAAKARIFASYGVGINHIDLIAATARGIVITNTPGVLTEVTAELTWAILLAAARRVIEGYHFVKNGFLPAQTTTTLLGTNVCGKTLGIIGMGRIGSAVARMSRGFSMKILYYDKLRREDIERELGARCVSLEELMQQSDFIAVHVAMNPGTRHMIREKEIKLMKPTAFLINVSRGEVIDEKALVSALRNKQIAGAAIDVYEHEPELSPGLTELPNVVLSPHAGSATVETRTKMAVMAAESIVAFLKGKTPSNIVNPEVLVKIKQERIIP